MSSKQRNSNLLAISCVYRSPNSTVNNLDNLNVLLKNIFDKYNTNLIVLGDFNYPRIDWVHYSTNSSINDSDYKFLETTRDFFSNNCFFMWKVDLVLSNNDDLIDNVSLLPPLGKSDHFTIEVSVNYSNNGTDKFYLDYNNTDFGSMKKIFNDEFNVTLKGCLCYKMITS